MSAKSIRTKPYATRKVTSVEDILKDAVFAWECDVCERMNYGDAQACECGRKFKDVPDR